MVMMLSTEDRGLRNFFELVEAHHARGMLGLGKLLDPAPLESLVAGLVGEEVTLSTEGSAGWAWSSPGGVLEMDPGEVFGLLFEPEGMRTQAERLELALDTPLPGLPLQPFVWGLDSI